MCELPIPCTERRTRVMPGEDSLLNACRSIARKLITRLESCPMATVQQKKTARKEEVVNFFNAQFKLKDRDCEPIPRFVGIDRKIL